MSNKASDSLPSMLIQTSIKKTRGSGPKSSGSDSTARITCPIRTPCKSIEGKSQTIQAMADRHSGTGENSWTHRRTSPWECISSDVSRMNTETKIWKKRRPAEKMHVFWMIIDPWVARTFKRRKMKFTKNYASPRNGLPTTVHLIGPRDYSKQVFGLTDDFVFDDISEKCKRLIDPCLAILVHDGYHWIYAGWIDAARAKVLEIAGGLVGRFSKLRLGFLGYRDLEDSEQFSILDFTSDPALVKSRLDAVAADGGGDGPENVLGALEQAWRFSWNAQQRILIHVADAPGHGPRGSQRTESETCRALLISGLNTPCGWREIQLEIWPQSIHVCMQTSALLGPWKRWNFSLALPDEFKAAVMDAAFEATPFASGTFMWQYIYETLRAGHSHDEEVVMAMTMTMVPDGLFPWHCRLQPHDAEMLSKVRLSGRAS